MMFFRAGLLPPFSYQAVPIILPITLIKSIHIIINMVRLYVSLLAVALAAGPALAFSDEYYER